MFPPAQFFSAPAGRQPLQSQENSPTGSSAAGNYWSQDPEMGGFAPASRKTRRGSRLGEKPEMSQARAGLIEASRERTANGGAENGREKAVAGETGAGGSSGERGTRR